MAEISVIIPVYNRPRLLLDAGRSVLAQTFSDFELIIIDDGSTDHTIEAAGRIEAESGGRCRIITVPHSGMPGAARNRGIEAAGGRYLAFLDSDDYWTPEKLKTQQKLMCESGANLSHTLEIWNREGREISQKGQKHSREGNVFPDALKKCTIGPSTVMIDREFCLATGGFHENLEIAEDYEYWLRITSASPVAYLHEAHTVKRAGKWAQLSEKYGKIEWFRLTALAGLLGVQLPDGAVCPAYLDGYRWRGFSDEYRKAAMEELSFKCGVWAAGCRKRGRFAEASQMEDLITKL